MTTLPHVVVVGAGIVGSAIAVHLVERGARVTVLDGAEPGAGATFVSFAWINARDKSPRHYHDLNRRSIDLWRRFGERLGDEVGLTWGGEIRWASTAAGAEKFSARVRELQGWGYPIRLLWAEQLRELEPAVEFGKVARGSFTAIDGHVDAVAAVRAARAFIEARGAVVRSGEPVQRLGRSSARERRVASVVLATGEEVACDVVVLAAGTGATSLASSAGVEIPQRPTSGATIVTTPVARIFRQVAAMHTARDSDGLLLNMRQFGDGRVMVHGGTHDGSIGDRSGSEAELLLTEAARYLPPLKEGQVSEVRRAFRPMPLDGHPVIGFASSVPNLYLAVTHSGVTLAPLIGEFAAIEILDGVEIDLLKPYRAERFQGA